MMIEHEMIERYLDGECSAAESAALEAAAAGDASVAALVTRERAVRQSRAAVFASYAPSAAEARAAADAVMAAAYAPVGSVGTGRWVRRFSAVAAAAAIVAGAFFAGRATATAPASTAGTGGPLQSVKMDAPLADHPYTVVYWNTLGEPLVRQFANAPDVDAFVTELQARGGGEVAVSVSPDDTALSLGDTGSF